MADGQAEVTDEHRDQQPIVGGHPARHPQLQPQRDVGGARQHRDQSAGLARSVRPLDRSRRQRQLLTRIRKRLAQQRIHSAPGFFRRLPGDLDGRFTVAGRPYNGNHALHVDGAAAFVEGDRQHLGHALGHTDRRRQPHHRAFPCGESSFGGDVANRAHVHVAIRDGAPNGVDADRHPDQMAVAMPDRRLVLGEAVPPNPLLLLGRAFLVEQPRMRPAVRQAFRG